MQQVVTNVMWVLFISYINSTLLTIITDLQNDSSKYGEIKKVYLDMYKSNYKLFQKSEYITNLPLTNHLLKKLKLVFYRITDFLLIIFLLLAGYYLITEVI